jgi:hypothetical protein
MRWKGCLPPSARNCVEAAVVASPVGKPKKCEEKKPWRFAPSKVSILKRGSHARAMTMVAAAGDIADAGLPVIWSAKRMAFQHVENGQGLSLTDAMPGAWTVMGESVWSMRGHVSGAQALKAHLDVHGIPSQLEL